MILKKITQLFLLIFSFFFIVGCNEKVNKEDDALSLLETEIFYHQSIDLPEGAVLEVRLEDVSKMDVASELISLSSRTIKGSFPYSMRIMFPTKRNKIKRSYSLVASIKVDGKLHFRSTSYVNPFEVGHASPIKIEVEKVEN